MLEDESREEERRGEVEAATRRGPRGKERSKRIDAKISAAQL